MNGLKLSKVRLSKNRKQYKNHAEILDQAVEDVENEESGNTVAPNTLSRIKYTVLNSHLHFVTRQCCLHEVLDSNVSGSFWREDEGR